MASDVFQDLMQEVKVMKEEVKLLLNKIKDLKGEFDVDRVAGGRSNNKVSTADVTRPAAAKQ